MVTLAMLAIHNKLINMNAPREEYPGDVCSIT